MYDIKFKKNLKGGKNGSNRVLRKVQGKGRYKRSKGSNNEERQEGNERNLSEVRNKGILFR